VNEEIYLVFSTRLFFKQGISSIFKRTRYAPASDQT